MRGGHKVKKHGPNAGMDQIASQVHPAIKVRHDMNPERGHAKGHKGYGRSRKRSR